MHQICVLISGGGSNLAALIAAIHCYQWDICINSVIADRACAGKQHAIAAQIPFHLVDRTLDKTTFAEQLIATVPPETELIVLAGFLSIIPPSLLQHFPRIINIHPSLLPKFGGAGMYGLKVHQAVIAAGERESGCTVHWVNQEIDGGAILAQNRVSVFPDDTPEQLQQRILAYEHQLLPATIARLFALLPPSHHQ